MPLCQLLCQMAFSSHLLAVPAFPGVVTENSVRSENTGGSIIREIMVATTMSSLFVAFFALIASTFRTRAALQAEILALRHQLAVFQKNAPRRLRLHRCDRLLWVLLYRFWSSWRRCLAMVQPDTVIRWHRKAFAWHWTRKSRRLPGRPEVAANIRDLIRRMSQANPLWGAPRIHGELLKLGIAVAQSTVARYLPRLRKPPSQTWRPEPRGVEPPEQGRVVAIPQVGGLHHRYQRRAA
jgi:hypothetical protein